jgi:hypothetical protein
MTTESIAQGAPLPNQTVLSSPQFSNHGAADADCARRQRPLKQGLAARDSCQIVVAEAERRGTRVFFKRQYRHIKLARHCR